MNWQLFSIIGYTGIALAVAAVALWLVHWKRPLRWLPAAGLVLAIASMAASRINSSSHVSRIAVDPAERLAQMKALEEKKRQAIIDSRSDEVAQIQFAEDDKSEFLDKAGLDETELKYLEATLDDDTPDWKKQKKSRGDTNKQDDSLESMIGADDSTGGADVSEIEETVETAEPILMSEAEMVMANRLDHWNLQAAKWLLWIAIAVLVLDYLRRANHYHQATWPLPLPSRMIDAFTPLATVNRRPQPRRDTAAELAWLTRRGDSWILFTDKPGAADDLPGKLASLRRWPHRLDLIHLDDRIDDELVFEMLWYGRASFIVDSPARTQSLLDCMMTILKQRRTTRARAPQTVHLVWDCSTPLPADTLSACERACRDSGVSFFILNDPTS